MGCEQSSPVYADNSDPRLYYMRPTEKSKAQRIGKTLQKGRKSEERYRPASSSSDNYYVDYGGDGYDYDYQGADFENVVGEETFEVDGECSECGGYGGDCVEASDGWGGDSGGGDCGGGDGGGD